MYPIALGESKLCIAMKNRSRQDRRFSIYFPTQGVDRRAYQDRRDGSVQSQGLPMDEINHSSGVEVTSNQMSRDKKVVIAVLILAVVVIVAL